MVRPAARPEKPESPEADPLSAEPRGPAESGAGQNLAVPGKAGKLEKLNALQYYLMEARRYSMLTQEQELELAKRYREQGDKKAAQRLVLANLRLVVKLALEYKRHWLDLLDLIQEGNLGLLQGVKKFDPYRGIKFSTYASFWIKAYILKFLMDNYRLVKIGTTQAQRKLFFNLRKEKERLEAFGFKPTLSLLAKNLSTTEDEVEEMEIRLNTPEESLENPVTDDGQQTLGATIPAEGEGLVEKLAEGEFRELISAKLKEFRKQLAEQKSEKELFIFDRRLMAEKPMTLREVGDKFKISRERIRQLEVRLLRKLKAFLKKELPDFEDFDFLKR
jgi:RNA polymerase sigma-32 factor